MMYRRFKILDKYIDQSHIEARQIVSQYTTLRPKEIVHHLNGNPFDNRLCNLKVFTPKEHYYYHKTFGGVKTCKHKSKIGKINATKLEMLLHLNNIGEWIDL